MDYQKEIKKKPLPHHIAIIMDGNGRWAKRQGLFRVSGHEKGSKTVRRITEAAAENNIKYLTLFAFSSENWSRPKREVDTLMKLLVATLKKEIKTLQDNDIKLTSIGNIEMLPETPKNELKYVIDETKHNKHMVVSLALSYGSREEIVSSFKKLATQVKEGELEPENIDQKQIEKNLFTAGMPDVDLLIRTSGEQRISNFLLWQIAYAELYFCPKLWPDFKKEDFFEAIYNYQKRERRFGKTSEQLS
ncbi:MAG: isoprenyl transferase [Psychroflexus sp.]|jgi:undecaprenyl diphosphate synthase|nr:isoprenyl transferase [Psychroflexus sp.]MDR9447747.1 isoprenyl transferase [Psychroflexus sp.]